MVHRLYWRGDLRAHGSLQNGMYAGCSLHACMCPLYIHVCVCLWSGLNLRCTALYDDVGKGITSDAFKCQQRHVNTRSSNS